MRKPCTEPTLYTNNIVVTEQYGFRKGISNEDALFRLPESVFKAVNQKMHIGGMICDFAKAFDCVNYNILLVKLHFYGIQGVLEDWFRLYLTNRRQKVKLPNSTQNFFFDWRILKHESSQGPILWLLSFKIYKNDLPLRINSVSKLI